ncbi:Platinum sensitivity protein [Mortierella sp. NVP41]|nr:Platinum sensitivity protein [Mortierella sp. NVP41]
MRVHGSKDEDERALLDTIYQKQQESLLGWNEDHTGLELNFQETEGCANMWDTINDAQQHYVDGLFSLPVEESRDEEFTLPAPGWANLGDVNEAVVKAAMDDEDRLAEYVVTEDYFNKLLPALQYCEDMDFVPGLKTLRSILLTLIRLYEPPVMECILKDSNFVGCIGMLEYATEEDGGRTDYRQAYKQRANFRQIVAINDPEIEQKIHQVFRLHFLKDFALAASMDESLLSTVESLIYSKNVDIVKFIHMDRTFLKELFEIVKDPAATQDHRSDIVRFVYQYCTMAKRTGGIIYRKLCQLGLFNLLEHAFSTDETQIKRAGIEIILLALENSSGLVRSQVVEQAVDKCDKPLLGLIIQRFLAEADSDLMTQFAEIIRALLDIDPGMSDGSNSAIPDRGIIMVESSSRLDPDADKLLDLFYSQYCSTLVAPVLELTRASTRLDRSASARCASICKLVSFLVRQHPTRTKVLLSSSRLVEKIGFLLKNREKHLRMMALKVFRTCLGLKEDYYNRILIRTKIIHGVVGLLVDTKGKDDLVNSACLEFFEFIAANKSKLLIKHIATDHRRAFEGLAYSAVFKELMDQCEEEMPTPSSKPTWSGHVQQGIHDLQDVPTLSTGKEVHSGTSIVDPLAISAGHHAGASGLEAAPSWSQSLHQKAQGIHVGCKEITTDIKEPDAVSASPSPPLSPLPPVALRAGIAFVKAETDAHDTAMGTNVDPEQEDDSAAAQQKSDLATGVSGGPEADRVNHKRKLEECDTDSIELDARMQPRPKLDAEGEGSTIQETAGQSLTMDDGLLPDASDDSAIGY